VDDVAVQARRGVGRLEIVLLFPCLNA
jgi:hypothetical protein